MFFAVQGHSTASLFTFLSIMGETGSDLPQLNLNSIDSKGESGLSGEETVNLISRLFDSMLDKKFTEFQRGLEQKDLAKTSQKLKKVKKLKKEAKAANSFQFKGNKLQFEFNSTLLDSIDSVSPHSLEGNLTGVNQELENAKTLLKKRNKSIRLAGAQSKSISPTSWPTILRMRRNLGLRKEGRLPSSARGSKIKHSVQNRFKSSQEASHHAAGAGSFHSLFSQPFRFQQ